tara:strand:- start:253 stop:492 length:240 start_codon:yes stop_codon:yes gene_type:complete
MKIKELFTKHPAEVGENYCEHFVTAVGISLRLMAGALMQFLHALFPFFTPPLGLDVCSTIKYLQNKSPDERKKCDDDKR